MDAETVKARVGQLREGTPLVIVSPTGARWFGLFRGLELESENLLLGGRWEGDNPPYRFAFWEIGVVEAALTVEHLSRLIDTLPVGTLRVEGGAQYTGIATVPLMRAVGLVG